MTKEKSGCYFIFGASEGCAANAHYNSSLISVREREYTLKSRFNGPSCVHKGFRKVERKQNAPTIISASVYFSTV